MPGPYPLATLGCTITSAGITAPSYSDILASLQASMQQIFGSDIYLASDSQDGQMLAVFAKAVNDNNNQTIATYNSYSPAYAQGTALSQQVQINGISRTVATNSTVAVIVAGTVGTVITNGVVKDTAGNLWNLPASVTIGVSGATTVTATAQQPGAVAAPIGTVNQIYTPQLGWQTVTNSVQGTPGAPVESDAHLRQRQASSVAIPSQSIIGGIYGAVANVAGVTQVMVYDNDLDTADVNGIPPHCIAVVVAGGAVQDIVNAIGARKTPGTNTQGSITGTYTDSIGLTDPISYFPLTTLSIQVNIVVTPHNGYTSAIHGYIANAIAAYINGLTIGQTVQINKLYGPANLYGDAATISSGLSQAQLDVLSATYSIQTLQIGIVSGALGTADVPVTYTQAAVCVAANVTVSP